MRPHLKENSMFKKIVLSVVLILITVVMLAFSIGPRLLEQQFNQIKPHSAYPISDRTKLLHADLFIGDWHSDSMLWNRDLAEQSDYGHVDIPRMQQGNVAVQMFTTVTKSPSGLNYEKNHSDASDNITKIALLQSWPIDTWASLFARAMHQANKLHELAKQNPDDFMLITSKADLVRLLEIRKANPDMIGGLIGTEGSHALDGNLDNIARLHENGFRMMSLHHFFDNKLGGSLHGTAKGGLTDFGREALLRMVQQDIIVDVSHSSEQAVKDAMALTSTPFVVSHTGFKGHCDSPRNISDSLMQAIAKKGGLIAVGFWDAAVCHPSVEAVAESIQYGVELVGEDHISLGSDYDGATSVAFDTSELAALTEALFKQGLNERQIRKVMGANMLGFLERNLPTE